MGTAATHFRAMGTDVHVLVVGGPPALPDVARELVEALEARWSRFRPDSEVSHLNDPPPGRSPLGLGWRRIAVDAARSTVTLPAGVGFDPGGIGKGLAADLLVGELLARGAAGACANLGGDLRVDGDAPGGGPWVVDVGHPLRREPAATVGLRRGAVATSSRVRRAWGPRRERHHLIDPATGRPARTGVAAATVVAAEGWQAEVLAKAAFLAGLPEGLRLLECTGTDGLLVDDQGSPHTSDGFDRFTRRVRERAG